MTRQKLPPESVTLLDPLDINPLAAVLINADAKENAKNNYIGLSKPLAPDDPLVAKGVAELQELFPVTDAEVKYQEERKMAEFAARMAASRDENGAPRNFLQAHMTIIDQLLMNPGITTTALAHATGYSRSWLHKVMSADAFQAKLAERQKALCDPIILNAIKDRLNGVVSRSLEVLEERMDGDKVSLEAALAVFAAGSKAMGLGVAKVAPVVAQQFVVHVPPVVQKAADWAAQYGGGSVSDVAVTLEAEAGVEILQEPRGV